MEEGEGRSDGEASGDVDECGLASGLVLTRCSENTVYSTMTQTKHTEL